MLAVSQERSMKAIGRTCTVPNNDVSKLAYFLKCGTVYCGVDIIVDELVDFHNVHRLPRSRQDAIFQLAYSDCDDDALIGTTIFPVEDGHSLLKGSNNEFYEIEQVSSLLAADSSALIAGQHTEVAKIMVCNRNWLKKFYYDPINNNSNRIRRIMEDKENSEAVDALANLFAAIMS